MITSRAAGLIVLGVVAGALGGGFAVTLVGAADPHAPVPLIGSLLPDVPLLDASGAGTTLHQLTRGHPTLLLVRGAKDCFSCTMISMDMRIVRERIPGLATHLVLAGPEIASFKEYLKTEHLESYASLDSSNGLIRRLGSREPPLTLLLSADGRVLFADERSGSDSHDYTIGRLLPDLALALSPDTLTPR